MRLIDADKLYPDRMTNKGTVAISQSQIAKAPTVTTLQTRTRGHWIKTGDYYTGAYGTLDYVRCSCCNEDSLEEGNYCPNCGAKMVEPQESEDKG